MHKIHKQQECTCSILSYIQYLVKLKVKSLSRVRFFVTPRTVAHQSPLKWDSPGKSTGVGGRFLLQGIFPTQGSNPDLPHCRQMLYHRARCCHREALQYLVITYNGKECEAVYLKLTPYCNSTVVQ